MRRPHDPKMARIASITRSTDDAEARGECAAFAWCVGRLQRAASSCGGTASEVQLTYVAGCLIAEAERRHPTLWPKVKEARGL